MENRETFRGGKMTRVNNISNNNKIVQGTGHVPKVVFTYFNYTWTISCNSTQKKVIWLIFWFNNFEKRESGKFGDFVYVEGFKLHKNDRSLQTNFFYSKKYNIVITMKTLLCAVFEILHSENQFVLASLSQHPIYILPRAPTWTLKAKNSWRTSVE